MPALTFRGGVGKMYIKHSELKYFVQSVLQISFVQEEFGSFDDDYGASSAYADQDSRQSSDAADVSK